MALVAQRGKCRDHHRQSRRDRTILLHEKDPPLLSQNQTRCAGGDRVLAPRVGPRVIFEAESGQWRHSGGDAGAVPISPENLSNSAILSQVIGRSGKCSGEELQTRTLAKAFGRAALPKPMPAGLASRRRSPYEMRHGWVAERFKAPVLKTGRGVSSSCVRIPPHPPPRLIFASSSRVPWTGHERYC